MNWINSHTYGFLINKEDKKIKTLYWNQWSYIVLDQWSEYCDPEFKSAKEFVLKKWKVIFSTQTSKIVGFFDMYINIYNILPHLS